MSEENVELVRQSFEALAHGDFDTAFAAHDPDIEWTTAPDEPDAQTYRGREGIRRLAADVAEPWEDRFAGVVEFEDFIDCGEWVVVPWTARFRGRGSGITVDAHETYAVLVRDGRIVRVDEYRTKREALDAVRLRR